jgi:heme-degrading monooxygenase HmoA
MPVYHHVVLFRFHDETTEAQRTHALDALRALGRFPGVLQWQVELSLDSRKGFVIAELATFEDEAAFEAWRTSDEHRAVADEMRTISDWLVADFLD